MSPIRKADANQPAIVKALRWRGATVQHLHEVGRGCPDILVGFLGHNILMEIKSAKGTLTPDEAEWHQAWNGQVCIVRTTGEALDVLDALLL